MRIGIVRLYTSSGLLRKSDTPKIAAHSGKETTRRARE
jgi:hypothetical protein